MGIDEIAEGANESWEQCEEQLENVFKEKLGLENVQLNVHMWKSKIRVASYEFKSTKLRVQIHKLQVQIHELRVQIHEITSSNSQVTSSNPRVTSSNLQVTSSNPRVTSSNPRVRRLKA